MPKGQEPLQGHKLGIWVQVQTALENLIPSDEPSYAPGSQGINLNLLQ